MRILMLVHGFNSLAQRLFAELEEAGHEVSIEFDVHDEISEEAAALFGPDLILAPFLKRAIPDSLWRTIPCLIVHPGPPGDRGPSALDWAVLKDKPHWGVTVLQAEAEMDAGPVWGHESFPMRGGAKSSLYRREVTEAAVRAVMQALERFQAGGNAPPRGADIPDPMSEGWQGPARQADREIDWQADTSAEVLRKIRSADGVPGVKDSLFGREVFLYDAHAAPGLQGEPGEVIASSGPALARATKDGAVWIGHLRERDGAHPFKLPAALVCADELAGLDEIAAGSPGGYPDISYEESGAVGVLHFAFYNGAMGSEACARLLAAYREALKRPTKVLVLAGGTEFWSNGMNLNLIEAADNPADESWLNINAMDDLAEAVLTTMDKLTIVAMQGNAGAGGVFLARGADEVWLRRGVVLSPHYKDMGNLFGSEYWTYLLPLYAGEDGAAHIMRTRLPMGASEAVATGLADAHFGADHAAFMAEMRARAAAMADSPELAGRLEAKAARRAAHEAEKPLQSYRDEELAQMKRNFFGPDPSYHVARYNFVCKVPKSRTPRVLARHRAAGTDNRRRQAS